MANNIDFYTDIQGGIFDKVNSDTVFYVNDKGEKIVLYVNEGSLVPNGIPTGQAKKTEPGFERGLLTTMEVFRSFFGTIQTAEQSKIARRCLAKMLAGVPDGANPYIPPPYGEDGKDFDIAIEATTTSNPNNGDTMGVSVYHSSLFGDAGSHEGATIFFHDGTGSNPPTGVVNPIRSNAGFLSGLRGINAFGKIKTASGENVFDISYDTNEEKLTIKTTEAARGCTVWINVTDSGNNALSHLGLTAGTYVSPAAERRATGVLLNALKLYKGIA